ncbi:hypothetical protein ACFFX0_20730 [Citricoccus parietis]|uniref:Uncharacterized protein n=1 Tax=Citricoccus parietis TaxID=592307 RepID=A0ABV5G3H9_9MICC
MRKQSHVTSEGAGRLGADQLDQLRPVPAPVQGLEGGGHCAVQDGQRPDPVMSPVLQNIDDLQEGLLMVVLAVSGRPRQLVEDEPQGLGDLAWTLPQTVDAVRFDVPQVG